MLLYLRYEDMSIVKIIDVFSSLIWHKKFYECGDFELYLPTGLLTRGEINGLRLGLDHMYITRDDDDMVGLIEKISITQDADNGDYITITGRDVSHMLANRVNTEHFGYIGIPAETCRSWIDRTCMTPSDSKRKLFSFFDFAPGKTITSGEKITKFCFGSDMYTLLQETAEANNFGFKVRFDKAKKKFFLDIYEGNDHTGNGNFDGVTFSPEYNNVLDNTYGKDTSNRSNVAFIAGEGEGSNRKTDTVTNEKEMPSESYRKEIFIDARDVRSDETTNDGTEKKMTDAEYMQALDDEALEKLSKDHAGEETFECSIVNAGLYTYGEDYELGDIVNVEPTYAPKMKARVIGITESFDENGHTVLPELKIWEE